jgi:hypothetical protein
MPNQIADMQFLHNRIHTPLIFIFIIINQILNSMWRHVENPAFGPPLRNPYAAATFLTSRPDLRLAAAQIQPFLLRRNMAQKRHFRIAGRPGFG